MPIVIAIITYAILFIGGTAISNNLPKPTPVPTPISSPAPTKLFETPTPSIPDHKFNKVLKVIDGDTVNIEINGKSETIRLIGIDSPETVDPRKPIQCYGFV